MHWPNVTKHLVDWLEDYTGRPVYTETSTDLALQVPAYKISRVGGNQADQHTKHIQIEIEYYAETDEQLWELVVPAAEAALHALAANGTSPGGWYVDDVTETYSPAVDDYDNERVRKASGIYDLALRPAPTR